MEPQFWINAWNEGRTNFHRKDFNDKLLKYFPQLNPQESQNVFVPLCGKSKDLIWLHGLNLHVHGIELYDQAVEAFFVENGPLEVKKTQNKDFIDYSYKNIVISCGDFFKFNAKDTYDLVYDRASLVALPAPMRKTYASLIKQSVKLGGKYLLIVYEYDQSKLDGPPFSVDANEVHALYEDQFTIKLMESDQPNTEGTKFSVAGVFKEKVYIMEKVR